MTTWGSVSSVWKEGDHFSPSALEEWFPASPSAKEKRKELWRVLDSNGNGYVSLAEYDAWFNTRTLAAEKGRIKSSLFVYARPALIRAFLLANGVEEKKKVEDDDYVTKSEFLLLLLATQAALRIYRIFELTDVDGDRRVTRQEWKKHVGEVNTELIRYGCTDPHLTAEDYDLVDADQSGHILLDEAVSFFLAKICDNAKLLKENEEERRTPPRKSATPTPQQKTAPAAVRKPAVPHQATVPQQKTPVSVAPAVPQQKRAAVAPVVPRPKTVEKQPVVARQQQPQQPAKPAVREVTKPETPARPRSAQTHAPPPPLAVDDPPSSLFEEEEPNIQYQADNYLVPPSHDEYPLTLRYGNLEVHVRTVSHSSLSSPPPSDPIQVDFQGVRVSLAPVAERRKARSVERSVERDLPSGWSRRFDKSRRRPYYVDHNTKTTTWHHPRGRSSTRHSWEETLPSSVG